MKRIVLADVEDPKLKIISALYNHPRVPLRQVDLKKATGMGFHPLDYHLGPLVETGVIVQGENEKGIKTYLLQEIYYDETLFEGLIDSLDKVFKVIAMVMNTEDVPVVVSNLKYLVDLFCHECSR